MAEPIKTKYRVGGMDFAACASKIETAVSRIPGVSEVGASFTAGTLNVVHDAVPFAAIQKTVKSLGYSLAQDGVVPTGGARGPHDHEGHDHGAEGAHEHGDSHLEIGDGPWWASRKAMLTLACAAALVAAYLIGRVLPEIGHWAFLAALLVGLVPVARRAVAGALA